MVEEALKEGIDEILAILTPREEDVLKRRFGIGREKTEVLGEVGKEFGLTKERIRQIEVKALRKLQKNKKAKKIKEDFLQ